MTSSNFFASDRSLILRRATFFAALVVVAGSVLTARANAEAANDGSVEMLTVRDGKTVRLSVKDGKLSAQIDGNDVPASRIRERGNRVEILDDKGEVLQRFYVDRNSGSGMVLGDEFSDIEGLPLGGPLGGPMGDDAMEEAFRQHQEAMRRMMRGGQDANRQGLDARREAQRLIERLRQRGFGKAEDGEFGVQFHGLDGPAAFGSGNSVLMMSRVENGKEYEIEIKNGEVSASIDDKPIDRKNIRKTDTKVELLNDTGEVIATFDLPKQGRAFAGGRGQARNFAPGQPRAQGGAWERMERDGDPVPNVNMLFAAPPVMVGITMSSAPDAGGVRVDSVIEGLPADKAGVKMGDVIKSVEGSPIANQGDLRAILKNKKPGDAVKATISRDGKESEVSMTLEAFDPNKLPAARANVRNMPDAQQWNWQGQRRIEVPADKDQDWYEDARKQIDKALEEIRSKVNEVDREKIKAQAENALKGARDAITQAKEKAAKAFDEARAEGRAQWHEMFGPDDKVLADKQGQWFVVPQNGDAMDRLSRQLEALQRDLTRLHERLDEMEKKSGR